LLQEEDNVQIGQSITKIVKGFLARSLWGLSMGSGKLVMPLPLSKN
jgi:hypothetical protein